MSASNPTVFRSAASGRAWFWSGVVLALLGPALFFAQYGLKILQVPWQLPLLTTAGAALVLVAVGKRRTFLRLGVLGALCVLAGLQWFFLLSFTVLPPYEGPGQAASAVPGFVTTRADSRPFTDQDLRRGTSHVLTFFRGRW